MQTSSSNSLAVVALQSAQIRLGEVIGSTSYSVDVKNRIAVHHSIVRVRLTERPKSAKAYMFFRPGSVKQALREVSKRHRSNTEAFFSQHGPAFLSGSISDGSYDHLFPPRAYQTRTEKVLDHVDTQVCRRCSGKGRYTVARTEYPKTSCNSCFGTGGRTVTEYVNRPGTTTHGQSVQSFRACVACGGSGSVSGPMQTRPETFNCSRCDGRGAIETKHYRKKKVFLADAVCSRFQRRATLKWPPIIRRLIDHKLVSEESLFLLCEKSGQTCRIEGTNVIIDIKVNMTIDQCRVEVSGKHSSVSVLKLGDKVVLFADKSILDPYLARLKTDLGALSWKQVKAQAANDEFLDRMITHALKRTKPTTVVPQLGFMASRRRIGALMRRLRGVERRRRLISRLLAFGLLAAVIYIFLFHFGRLTALFR